MRKHIQLFLLFALVISLVAPTVALAGGRPDPVPLLTALDTPYTCAYQLEFETTALDVLFQRHYGLESSDTRCVNFWNGAYEQQIYLPRRDVNVVTGFGKEPVVVFSKAKRVVRNWSGKKRVQHYIQATVIAPAGFEIFAPMTGNYHGFYDPAEPQG